MQPATKPEAGKVDPGSGETAEEQAAKEEADARSVYVGNVDYECTPEELQVHFQVGSSKQCFHSSSQALTGEGIFHEPVQSCQWQSCID